MNTYQFGILELVSPGDEPTGEGYFPLLPAVAVDGSVVHESGEELLSRWEAKDLMISAPGRNDDTIPSARVSVTDRRVVFEVPDWRKLGSLAERIALKAMDRVDDMFRDAAMVGHLPLESIGKLSFSRGKSSGSGRFQFHSAARFGKVVLYTVAGAIPNADPGEEFTRIVDAMRRRWSTYDLPARSLQVIADRQASFEKGAKGTGLARLAGKLDIWSYTQALALMPNSTIAASPDGSLPGVDLAKLS